MAHGHVLVVCDADRVIAVFMLTTLAATSLLVAASFRLEHFTATLLAAYIALVAETSAVTLALSPFREVRRGPLALSEVALLILALIVWWRRGKPGLGIALGARAIAAAARDPVVVVFLAVVALALAYELVLVLTVPSNNWDSLTYHLARVAAWVQHGGVSWIPNAPTDRMNEFQPLAEQEILFLFVATGKGALFALPQYVAQFAILVAIYGAARRLGYAAACASLFFATFSLVALEATTSQNDLVAASFPVAAAALLLSGGTAEVVLAGIAVGLGLGVKLTTALVLPVLVVLAWRLGRRRTFIFVGASGAAFVALGMWSFVLNIAKTGHLLGNGGGRVENTASPSLTRGLSTAYRLLHRLLDLTGFSSWTVRGLVLAGWIGAGAAVLVLRRRNGAPLEIGLAVLAILLPLAAPTLIASFSSLLLSIGGTVHLPAFDPINERVNEDLSAFGPLAGPAVIGLSAYSLALAIRQRGDMRRVAWRWVSPSCASLLSSSRRPRTTRGSRGSSSSQSP